MNFRKIFPIIAATNLLAVASIGWSQEDAQEAPEVEGKNSKIHIEEVFVTARKRTENLQDVPLSIKALTGDDLVKIGAKTFAEYADEVPSLNFASTNEGNTRINIRGLQAPLGVAVVAYLINDIPQQDAGAPDTELFDVESVQVLRGPQGTLYGAGAVGGAIIIRTNAPNLEEFGWAYQGSYSKNSEGAARQENSVMINVPIIEGKVGFRGVGFMREADGWITVREPDYSGAGENQYSSENIVEEDANDKDVDGYRVALSYVPSDNLSFILRGSRQDSDIGLAPYVSPTLQERWGDWTANEGAGVGISNIENDYDLGTFHVSWDLPFATFEAISGIADNDVRTDAIAGISLPTAEMADPSGPGGSTLPIPTDLQDIIVGNGIYEMIDFALINQYQVKSQEVRLVSNQEGRFQYTAGFFFQDIKRKAFAVLDGRGNFGGVADATIILEEDRVRQAFFAEISYDITSKLNAVFGIRYFEEDIDFVANVDGIDEHGAFDNTSPKFGLNYEFTDNILGYAIAAEGFRSGGFNTPTTDPRVNGYQPSYESDILTSYEIGINSQFFDRRVTFNASVFQATWEKVQMDLRLTNDFGQSQTIVSNLADAHSKGVEWELDWIIDAAWSINFGGSYLDAELDEDAPFLYAEDGSEKIKKGTKLENVPEWSYNLALNHKYYFDNGWGLSSSVSYNFTDESHGCILTPKSCAAESRQTINMRIGLSGSGGKWDVTLFGKNITDEKINLFNFSSFDAVYRGDPRQIGIRFAWNGEA